MSKRPVPPQYGVTQSYYGSFSNQYQPGAALHGATDFGTPTGTPLIAPDDLTIMHAGWAYDLPGGPAEFGRRWMLLKPPKGDVNGGGGIILLGVNANGYVWYQAHLSATHLNVGDRVRAGDIIGVSGRTGIATGPHTHVGLIPASPNVNNGAYGAIDPMPYLDEPYAPNKATSWKGGATGGTGGATGTGATRPAPARFKLVEDLTGNRWSGRSGTKIVGIVIHWWDTPKKRPTLAGTRSWFKSEASQVSAHYVVEDGVVVRMVGEGDTAWHAGSRYWNERTIGIECNPRMTAGDLETVAQLIADIESRHGPMLVYRHSEVNPGTECPGTYGTKLGQIIARANQIKAAPAATVAPAKSSGLIEEVLGMAQAEFNRDKKSAGTPAWNLSNGRDHAANADKKLDEVLKLVRAVPSSTLTHAVRRSDQGGKVAETVTLAQVAAYDRQNWRSVLKGQADHDARLVRLESKLDALLEALGTTTKNNDAPATTPAEGK